MSNLRIALVQERPDQVYYSGSAIAGNVLLGITEPKSYKYVSIQFVGRSYVHWEERRTETSGNQRREVIYRYTSEEPYVDERLMLWTCQQSPDGKLGAAEYSWPFSFTIPPLAPSSFEGTVGNIRYSLEARIGAGILKFDHSIEVKVPVQQLVRVTDPRLLLPERLEIEKTLCCLCCASGPIVLNASVPKTGFCVGESFTLHTSVENGSNRRITLSASICQLVVYTAQDHQRTSRKTLSNFESDPIEPRTTREWDPVVAVPVTEIIGSCQNIQIEYTLVVAAKIPGALDLSRAIPLHLGNCSVQQQQGGQPPIPPAQGAVQHLPPNQMHPYPAPSSHPGPVYPPPPTSAPYPPPPPTSAPYPPPPSTSAPYPPQPPPGPTPTADAPIGWTAPSDTEVPPPGESGYPPMASENPPDTNEDSSSDNETTRLL